MRLPLMASLGLWLTAFALTSTPAAASYGSLDEQPAAGGELRLATPHDDGSRVAVRFPLLHTHVRADVIGAMAEVEVEQTWHNPYGVPIEAVYVFPLSTRAAVNAYAIEIGDRTIEGVIREREDALQVYQDARDRGQTAGLVEQDARDIFVQHIANIAPGEQIVTRFRYAEMLDYEHATGFRFHYPLTITPRYLAPDDTPSTRQPDYVEPTRSGAEVDIEVRIDAGMPIRLFRCYTHQIDIARNTNDAVVRLDPQDRIPNKDFVLHYRLAGEQPEATVLAHRDETLGGYYALMVQPKLTPTDADVSPREVVLLMDVSGSMDGASLDRSKTVAAAVLDSLTPRDTLNIITFASEADRWAEAARPATGANVESARRYLYALAAGGGTELDEGLRETLRVAPPLGRVRMLYIFTDGGVGDDEAAIDLVRDPAGHNRLFPVGVGASPNRDLIERIAELGRGFPTWLDHYTPAEEIADHLIRKTEWPTLTDVTVEFEGLDVDDPGPFRAPDLYVGLPLVVTGRYADAGEGRALIRGRRGADEVVLDVPVSLPADARNRPVAYAWVKREIDRLLLRRDADTSGAVVDAITALGLRFSVVTPYTSFVAVDEYRTVDGDPMRVEQPQEVPEGYGGRPVGNGGSGDVSGGGSSGGGSSGGGSSGGGSSSGGGGSSSDSCWFFCGSSGGSSSDDSGDDDYGGGDFGLFGALWLALLGLARRRA